MSSVQDFIAELRTTAWRTQSARYNAARRLKRRDWFGVLSIGGFSAIGVGVTIVQKVYGVTAGTSADSYLTALSVCLGLFVVVISLIEWGMSGAVKAEALYQNAQALSAFQRKLQQILAEAVDGRALKAEEITQLREEYERIKESCPYNHEPVDDQAFLVHQRFSSEYAKLFKRPPPGLFRALWVNAWSTLSVIWYFGLFWLAVLALCLMTPWGQG
jgi:hypothetical protein